MEEYHLDNIQQANDSVINVTTATMRFRVSEFRNKRDNEPKHRLISVEDLLRRMASPLIRIEKDGPAFSPATFHHARRCRENVIELSMLGLDYDANADWPGDLSLWFGLGVLFLAYTTHSHQRITADHSRAVDRFRIVIPLLEPISSTDFLHLWLWAYEFTGGKIDRAARDPSRLFYKPSKASDSSPYDFSWHRGPLLDWKKRIVTRPLRQRVQGHRKLSGAFDIRKVSHLLEGYHETLRGWAYARCPVHQGEGNTSLFISLEDGAYGCFAGCAIAEIRFAIGHPRRTRDSIIRTGGPLVSPRLPETAPLAIQGERPRSEKLDLG